MKALIVGGGIGGLTAAIGLRRGGVEVEVFERQPTIGAVGAAVQLWTNAVLVLDQLGVGEPLRAASAAVDRFQYRTSDGRLLLDVPLDVLRARYGHRAVIVSRAALMDLACARKSIGGSLPT